MGIEEKVPEIDTEKVENEKESDQEERGGRVQGHVPNHVTSPRDLIDLGQDHDTVHIANLDVHELGLDPEIAQDVHAQDRDLMEKNPKTRVKTKRKILAVTEVEVVIVRTEVKTDLEIRTKKIRKKIVEI